MLKKYITGFISSVILTLAAFFVVLRPGLFHVSSGGVVVIILALAVIQALVQLFFFLHLGEEKGPRWNLVVLLSTFALILILVVGSIWIMGNLNYNMMSMSPSQMDSYMLNQGSL